MFDSGYKRLARRLNNAISCWRKPKYGKRGRDDKRSVQIMSITAVGTKMCVDVTHLLGYLMDCLIFLHSGGRRRVQVRRGRSLRGSARGRRFCPVRHRLWINRPPRRRRTGTAAVNTDQGAERQWKTSGDGYVELVAGGAAVCTPRRPVRHSNRRTKTEARAHGGKHDQRCLCG